MPHRLKQYNTDRRLPSWEIVYRVPTLNRHAVELQICMELKRLGYQRARREFFECTPEDAISVINSILERN